MLIKILRGFSSLLKNEKNENLSAVGVLDKVVSGTEKSINRYTEPVRESILKRYPTTFSLLVSIGAIATFLGLEQILLKVDIFVQQPWLLFLLGVGILAFTGRLYKKLS